MYFGWQALTGELEEEEMPGAPILRGPYVVEYSDVLHDGDKKTLWTPEIGEVLLRLFSDWQARTQWDHGTLYIGQNVDGTVSPALNVLALSPAGGLNANIYHDLDLFATWDNGDFTDQTGSGYWSTAHIFHTTDPVQIQLAQTGGTDPTQGHVELYALVAQAVVP